MKRVFLILASFAFLLTSCVKDPEPDPCFSVLGDSFSSLEGYVDPETNDPWPNYAQIGVTGPEMMWWHQVSVETGWPMERNNSFSGSAICNYDPNNYYGAHSYLRRMDDLGNPNVIFVFGGTNDIYYRLAVPTISTIGFRWANTNMKTGPKSNCALSVRQWPICLTT